MSLKWLVKLPWKRSGRWLDVSVGKLTRLPSVTSKSTIAQYNNLKKLQIYFHPPLPVTVHQITIPTAFNDSNLGNRRNKLGSDQITWNHITSLFPWTSYVLRFTKHMTLPPVHITATTKCWIIFLNWLWIHCCDISMIPGLLETSLQLGQKLPSYQSPNRERTRILITSINWHLLQQHHVQNDFCSFLSMIMWSLPLI